MRKGWQHRPLADFVRSRGGNNDYIKGRQSAEPAPHLFQGFSASGPDVWVSVADYEGPGVVLSAVGARCGKTFLAQGKWTAIANTHVIIPTGAIDCRWLWYLTNNEAFWLKGGSAQPFVKVRETLLRPQWIPPVSEQQRIVAVLDETFGGLAIAIANADKNLKNARELFDSYLNSVFSEKAGKGEEKRLSELCREMTVGHVGPIAKRYKPSGIPFLRSQNIKPFEVELDDVAYIDEGFHQELRKSQLRPGDVAIVRTGYPGTAAVIPEELKISNCADLVIVRCGDQLDPRYVAAFFNSSYGKHLVSGNLNGTAQKHFNVTSAKGVKIALPSKSEQADRVNDVEAYRDQCRALELGYKKKQLNLSDLKQCIVKKAFSGELTWPPMRDIQEAAE